jgi:pimeloyl-ACP methyl ester carboxylesterase
VCYKNDFVNYRSGIFSASRVKYLPLYRENMMTIENICFETQWDDTTIHLAPQETTLAKKVGSVALDVFSVLCPFLAVARYISYKLDTFANRVSLPAAHYISETEKEKIHGQFHDFWYGSVTPDNQLLRAHYRMIEQTVRTPDGVDLQAFLLQYKDSTTETPTILYFNGNFQLCAETPTWILEESLRAHTPCNLVLFDYRGVGNSTGQFTGTKDLVIDGSSIVSWLRKQIGIVPSQLHFYGFSLGGAISSLTKALDPDLTGKLVNDRSFGSSGAVICERYGSGYVGRLISWMFEKYGYSATPSEELLKAQGEKLVIYHPEDTLIPQKAGMYRYVPEDLVFRLEPKKGFEPASGQEAHVSPLAWHEQAVEKVLEFLLTSPAQTTVGIA